MALSNIGFLLSWFFLFLYELAPILMNFLFSLCLFMMLILQMRYLSLIIRVRSILDSLFVYVFICFFFILA